MLGRNKSGSELKKEIADATAQILQSQNGDEAIEPLNAIRRAFKQANSGCFLPCHEVSRNPEGFAIAPSRAADCIEDYERTRQFLIGITKAIRTAQERFHGEVIRVLYAGCGPYGTLAIPLLCGEFEPDEVQFTFVDIHMSSIESVQRIIEKLGLRPQIPGLIQDNAITYRHDGPPPHVAITETMLPALMFEPQASISANIASQLHAKGILVPEKITLRVYAEIASKLLQWAKDHRMDIGTLFELTKETPYGISSTTGGKNVLIEKVFSSPPIRRAYDLFIGTQVKVFGDAVLPEETAQITRARFVKHIPANKSGQSVKINYWGGASDVNVEVLPDVA